MPLCKWHTFWMSSRFVVLLPCYFILRENDFLWEIYPQSYPWSSNCLENFSFSKLLIEISKCWKIVELPKITIKMKNFTSSKQRAALRKLVSSQQIKASYVSWTKVFIWRVTGIYRNLLSNCFENAFLESLEMVQCKWLVIRQKGES